MSPTEVPLFILVASHTSRFITLFIKYPPGYYQITWQVWLATAFYYCFTMLINEKAASK